MVSNDTDPPPSEEESMAADVEDDLEEVVARIAGLTKGLLEEGHEPSRVAYVLVSVAADMGLQVCGDPLRVFPLLLGAMSQQALDKLQSHADEEDAEGAHITIGATVH